MPQLYTTADELSFIEELCHRDPDRAKRYCELVLLIERKWDRGIDVDAVRAKAREVLDRA